MDEKPTVLTCVCGKSFGADPKNATSMQTLKARFATHQRTCAKANPKAAAERQAIAERLTASRGQELRADVGKRTRAADGAAEVVPDVVAKIDPAALRADLASKKARKPKEPAPAPTPAPAPAPTPVIVAPVAPPAPPPASSKSKADILPQDWTEMVDVLHEAESALAASLAHTDAAAMKDSHRRIMSKIAGKLLSAMWDDLTVAQSTKILVAMYLGLQVVYLGQAAAAGKQVRDAEKKERARQAAAAAEQARQQA